MIRYALFAAALCLCACSVKSERYCDEDQPCENPALPFCDLNGQYEAFDYIRNTCIPDPGADDADAGTQPSCTAAGKSCSGDTLVTCDDAGEITESVDCPMGCFADESRCYEMVPSNGLGDYLELARDAPALVLTDGATIDTTTGEIRNGDGAAVIIPSELLDAPEGGVPVRVLMASTAELGDVNITGEPAIALVADGEIRITGELALVQAPGELPPGSLGYLCSAPFGYECRGGSGGGFGEPGGRGGAPAGKGPPPVGAEVGSQSLEPLRGGCNGGAAFESSAPAEGEVVTGGRRQGTGGGAIQLTSGSGIRIALSGNLAGINAHGYGAPKLIGQLFTNLGGGAGGGSGGGILIEAPVVSLQAGTYLAANGGGGGACAAESAENGGIGDAPAVADSCDNVGTGGAGGSASSPAENGSPPPAGKDGAGGGGGAVGRIRINAMHTDGLDEALLSPLPSVAFPRRR